MEADRQRRLAIATLLKRLEAAYPRQTLRKDTIVMYVSLLEDLDPRLLEQVVYDWCKTEPFWPSVAELRRLYAEKQTQIPSVHEAEAELRQWLRHDGQSSVHPMVRKAILEIGEWELKHGDKSDHALAAFRRVYETMREQEIKRIQQGGASHEVRTLEHTTWNGVLPPSTGR